MQNYLKKTVMPIAVILTTIFMAGIFVSCNKSRDDFNGKLYSPDKVAMSADSLENVRQTIQKNIDDKKIAGAVTAIVRHNKLVWFEAQGVSNPVTGRLMQKDDIFHMMSSTKQVTSVAVLMMMEEGKLALDDKVSKFIPSFNNPQVAVVPKGTMDASEVKLVPADREITIKDLLTHTSGLSTLGAGILVNKIERKPDDSLADYVPRLGEAALDFQPGTEWRYSPSDGMDVLLHIVEIVSGQPADLFLRERIFKPLDMAETYFIVPDEKKDRIVAPYNYQDGEWERQINLLGSLPSSYFSGAGGLLSTVHDYLNFEVMLLNKGEFNGYRLLKPETVEKMSTNQVGSLFAEYMPIITDGLGFGFGVSVVLDPEKGQGRSVGAFGWGGAFGTESWVDPALDVAAVMFIQASPAPREPKVGFQQAIRSAIVE